MKDLRSYQVDLIDKTRAAIRSGSKTPCIVSPCGSGKSIMIAEIIKSSTKMKNNVLFLVHRRELVEQIQITLTEYGVDLRYVQIGMVQTIVRNLETTREPNLIVCDESHHVLANSYKKIYSRYPDIIKVGFTATPIRLNGGGLGEINDTLIIGPSVGDLIEWGNLSPFKYYAPQIVDTSKLKVKRGEYVQSDVDEMFSKRTIWGDVIQHYRKLSGGKAICYCSSIKQSQEMASEFCRAGIPAKHIDAKTPPIERKQTINQFRKGIIKILCNVDLISEGFDVPDCDAAILLRPTQSLGLFIQQSMRCMRFQPGKTAVIIDHVGNVNRFGTPDVNREWSLEPKKKKSNIQNLVEIKQCPECFRVVEPDVKECPHCGFLFQRNEVKDADIVKEAELIEIDHMESFTVDYRKPSDCKNMAELYQLAENMGYKKGWAWFQGKALGYVR